ncbi:membrane protein insertion efficiency factor YidD [Stackebrandtia soli]|uniref:membrane protein insertion efficiency factor YidD n=1 Tax=Stackebrandtia soli TaxID=1892856 RepID=UPI0039E8CA90
MHESVSAEDCMSCGKTCSVFVGDCSDVLEGFGAFVGSCSMGIDEAPFAGMLASVLVVSPTALRPLDEPTRGVGDWPRRFGMWMITQYQRRISRRLPTRCRYTPSCSRYGKEALRRYGLVTGSRLALLRILRCRGDVPPGTVDELK